MRHQAEISLICFTVCVPAAAGLSLFSLIMGGGFVLAAAAVLLVFVGAAASVAHLAKPLRAPRSLAHWRTSWLSREIIAVTLFGVLCLVWCAAQAAAEGWCGQGALMRLFVTTRLGVVANALAVCGGAALLVVIAKAYAVHAQPAWNGPDTLWELCAGAVGAGGCLAGALGALQALLLFAAPFSLSLAQAATANTSLLLMAAGCAAGGTAVSFLLFKFAGATRARRVEALLQEQRNSPRVLRVAHRLEGMPPVPQLAGPCLAAALIASLAALLVGAALLAAGSAAVPWAFAAAFALLAIASACQFAAQASVRNRFYSLVAHDRFVV